MTYVETIDGGHDPVEFGRTSMVSHTPCELISTGAPTFSFEKYFWVPGAPKLARSYANNGYPRQEVEESL
jgi:hypothetical protein